MGLNLVSRKYNDGFPREWVTVAGKDGVEEGQKVGERVRMKNFEHDSREAFFRFLLIVIESSCAVMGRL